MGEFYQELISTSANPNLLAENIFNLYNDPKLKFYYADRYSKTIHGMVPKNEGSTTYEGEKFQSHGFSYNTMSDRIEQAAKRYA